MLSKKRNGTVLVLGILMSLSIASVAFAGTYSAPGVNCVDEKGYIEYGGWAYNSDTSSMTTFFCPIIRYGLDTTDLSNLYVSMEDQNNDYDGSVSCFLRSCNLNGIGCTTSSAASTGGTWRGTTTLSMGSVDGYTNGAAFMQCSIPHYDVGYSGIHGYRWTD